MSQHTIANQFITATFNSKGAELSSLQAKNIEYIWQANPEFWNRHAPILFPFVGSEKNGTYFYKGKSYQMGQHGFARDKEFTVTSQQEDSITFLLSDDENTLKVYPFKFNLYVTYTLNFKTLDIHYKVENPSTDKMYFSIGAHPAFNCPLEKDQTREEYFILFDNEATPEAQMLQNGLRTDNSYKVFEDTGILDITKDRFDKDAIVFNPNPFNKATLVHEHTGDSYVTVTFENFPYLGIWSKNQDAPFVCIEPWYGIADHENHNQELTEKEGILSLESNQTFECAYSFEIH